MPSRENCRDTSLVPAYRQAGVHGIPDATAHRFGIAITRGAGFFLAASLATHDQQTGQTPLGVQRCEPRPSVQYSRCKTVEDCWRGATDAMRI